MRAAHSTSGLQSASVNKRIGARACATPALRAAAAPLCGHCNTCPSIFSAPSPSNQASAMAAVWSVEPSFTTMTSRLGGVRPSTAIANDCWPSASKHSANTDSACQQGTMTDAIGPVSSAAGRGSSPGMCEPITGYGVGAAGVYRLERRKNRKQHRLRPRPIARSYRQKARPLRRKGWIQRAKRQEHELRADDDLAFVTVARSCA